MKALLAAVLFVALAGCGSDPLTVKGHLTLKDPSSVEWLEGGVEGSGMSCQGTDGYDDITQGAAVVVRDGGGNRVALDRLGPGEGVRGGYCRFAFKISDVDSDSKILSVEVTHRGEITFKRSESGYLEVTLG